MVVTKFLTLISFATITILAAGTEARALRRNIDHPRYSSRLMASALPQNKDQGVPKPENKPVPGAEYVKRGREFFDHDDCTHSLLLFRKAAALGNAAGKNELGTMYANGICVKADLDKAFSLWMEAAKAGDARAASGLAQMYALGLGPVRQNYESASYWAQKAAAEGNVRAFCEVGSVIAKMNRTDPAAAIQFFQMGVDRGEKTCAKLRDEVVAQWSPVPSPYRNRSDCKDPDEWDKEDQICIPSGVLKGCVPWAGGQAGKNRFDGCVDAWKHRVLGQEK